jgi:AraC-like DNA-binding protein
MEGQHIYIPADTREQFLNSPPPPIPYLINNNIEWVGISYVTDGYRAERHNLKTHFILYTLDGMGYLKVNGHSCYELPKGKVFIAPATSEYSYWTDQNWSIMWSHFFCNSFWDQLFPSHVLIRQAEWAEDLKAEMESYLAEMSRFREDSVRALHARVDLITLYFQRELERNHPRTSIQHRALESVWSEVKCRLDYHWEIEELAEMAHMSRSSLYRMVKKQTGLPPLQVVHSMRMEHASTLLLYSDYTLSNIAEAVGYEDQFSFSSAFKRYTGKSPSEFKKQLTAQRSDRSHQKTPYQKMT